LDKSKGTARYTSLEKLVILTQTDTTVGFLSQNKQKLDFIKSRPSHKPYLINFFDFATLKEHLRVPKTKRKMIRRAKKTTFIVKDQAFRVAKPQTTSKLLRDLKWCYSTSANESGKNYDEAFALQYADVVIKNKVGLFETTPSKLLKINHKKSLRLR